MKKQTTALFLATALLLVAATACEKAQLNVEAPERASLKGNVTLEEAEDHEGIEVYLPGTAWRAMTDRDGDFAFHDIRSGTYEIVARHEGYEPYRSEVLSMTPGRTLSLEPIVLTLDESLRTGTILGRVLLQGSNTHAGAIVALEGSPYTYATGKDGHFQFQDVPPDSYILSAQKAGYRWQHDITVNLSPDGVVNVGDIELTPTGGSTANETSFGPPAVVEGVVFRANDLRRGGTLVEITQPARSLQTSATGFFRFTDVPPGVREFTFSHSGFFPITTSARIQSATTNILQTVRLRPRTENDETSGVLEGFVDLQDADDNSGVTVELIAANENEPPQQTATSASGRFVFRQAPDGEYSVRASMPGYAPMTAFGIEIRDGLASESPTLTLVPDNQSATDEVANIQGTALLQGEEDHGGILIALDGTSWLTKTDDSGYFRLEGVNTGTYTLRATKDGFKPVILDQVMAPQGGNVTLPPFTLEPDVDWIEVLETVPPDGASEVVLTDIVPVLIRFDRPVIGPSAKQAVSIEPAVATRMFHGSESPRSDPSSLYIELLRSQRPAVTFKQNYTVRLDASIRDYAGNTMEQPYVFRFETAGARIIGSWPEDGAEDVLFTLDDGLIVDFNTEVDADRLSNALSIRPSPASTPLLYIERTNFGYRANFELDLEENTRYTVSIGDRLRTTYGERFENTPYRFRFRTGSIDDLPVIGEDIPIDELR